MPVAAASFACAARFLAVLCITTPCITTLLISTPAHAAELLLAQPSACAIGDELSFRVERALGRPLAEAGGLRCTVQMAREQGSYSARLEIERPGQPARSRSFRAPTCEKLTDTLALAIVLAIGAPDDTGSDESAAMSGGPGTVSPGGVGAPAPIGDGHTAAERTADRGAGAPTGASSGAGPELHTTLAAALVLDVRNPARARRWAGAGRNDRQR